MVGNTLANAMQTLWVSREGIVTGNFNEKQSFLEVLAHKILEVIEYTIQSDEDKCFFQQRWPLKVIKISFRKKKVNKTGTSNC